MPIIYVGVRGHPGSDMLEDVYTRIKNQPVERNKTRVEVVHEGVTFKVELGVHPAGYRQLVVKYNKCVPSSKIVSIFGGDRDTKLSEGERGSQNKYVGKPFDELVENPKSRNLVRELPNAGNIFTIFVAAIEQHFEQVDAIEQHFEQVDEAFELWEKDIMSYRLEELNNSIEMLMQNLETLGITRDQLLPDISMLLNDRVALLLQQQQQQSTTFPQPEIQSTEFNVVEDIEKKMKTLETLGIPLYLIRDDIFMMLYNRMMIQANPHC